MITLELGRAKAFLTEAGREAEEVTSQYGVLAVGLPHSRGVSRVMPAEGNQAHSKGATV